MIDHKSNGYLAEYADSEDLAKGIEWIIDQPDDSYRKRSRDKIVKTFTRSVVTPKYIELYCETVKHTQT